MTEAGGRLKAIGASALVGTLACFCLASPANAVTAFWANAGANKISHAPQLEQGHAGDLAIDPAYLNVPRGVAVNSAAGKVYWLNTGDGGSIGYANLDGSGAGFLNTTGASFSNPSGLAIDPAAGRIYWGNSSGGSIGYAALDGSGGGLISIAGATAEPTAIAVDPVNGRIYWTNLAANAISFARLDGSGAQDLDTSGAPVDGPSGIAIISRMGTVYWANRDGNSIGYAGLDGGGGGTANLNLFVGEPVGLATDGETLFWASREEDGIRDGNLAGCCTTPLDTAGATQRGVSAPVLVGVPLTDTIGIPMVSGTHTPGSTLTCSPPNWREDLTESFFYRAPQSIAYQWLRNKQPIVSATGQTLTAAKVGDYGCQVGAFNFAGGDTNESLRPFRVRASIAFGRVTYNRRKGTATLRVAVTGSGRIDVFGKGVANVSRKHASGTVKLVVRAGGKARIKLNHGGRVRVRATVAYTPEGGKAIKRRKAIALRKKLRR